MSIRTKSVYEVPSADDGLRVLTTQYWPRGISREKVGKYVRVLGPSRDLLHAFKSSVIAWPEYKVRYFDELRNERAENEIQYLANLAKTETITVMCMCKEESECHRTLLKGLIEAHL